MPLCAYMYMYTLHTCMYVCLCTQGCGQVPVLVRVLVLVLKYNFIST